jgi:hypothetical protein
MLDRRFCVTVAFALSVLTACASAGGPATGRLDSSIVAPGVGIQVPTLTAPIPSFYWGKSGTLEIELLSSHFEVVGHLRVSGVFGSNSVVGVELDALCGAKVASARVAAFLPVGYSDLTAKVKRVTELEIALRPDPAFLIEMDSSRSYTQFIVASSEGRRSITARIDPTHRRVELIPANLGGSKIRFDNMSIYRGLSLELCGENVRIRGTSLTKSPKQ